MSGVDARVGSDDIASHHRRFRRSRLDECVRLMERHGIYHLPVVDENRYVFDGMISVQDLPRVIASDEKARADMLESFLFSSR